MSEPSTPAPRRLLRPPLRLEGVAKPGERPFFLGYVANLSRTGLFVQTIRSREVGSRLRVRLHLPEAPGGALDLEAEVCWTRGYCGKHGPSAGLGLRFVSPSAASGELLQRFCARAGPLPRGGLAIPA